VTKADGSGCLDFARRRQAIALRAESSSAARVRVAVSRVRGKLVPATLFSVALAAGLAVLLPVMIGSVAADEPADEAAPGPVAFSRDVQPILADKCYACHGPDAAQRQADLRLDREADVFAERDGATIVVRGEPARSELWRRVSSEDEFERMPPADSDLTLTPDERETIRRWIAAGAPWGGHWAFDTPLRPALPPVDDASWQQTPIDAFVLARLDRLRVTPSPQAARATLIRRVTLDLTGLPPMPAEVADFESDDAPNAYERLVDRLLASPRYGECMAVAWLDAARYADTSGYQTDGNRQMWRWRDWVIDAFNRNLPFDQFTIQQMAGDLLPDPTVDQLIATGFHRNHRANSEGGIIDEEFLVEYAVDRVETTGTVWLGMTVGCARCHDHKYDPLSQRDFYGLMAFFDNVPERGRVFKHHNSEPLITAPTPRMQLRLDELRAQWKRADGKWRGMQPALAAARSAWEKSPAAAEMDDAVFDEALAVRLPLDIDLRVLRDRTDDGGPDEGSDATSPDENQRSPDTGVASPMDIDHARAADGNVTFEAEDHAAVKLDGTSYLDAGAVLAIDGTQPVTVAAWIRPDSIQDGAIVSVLDPAATRAQGFSLHLHENRLGFHIGPRWIDDALRIETREAIPPAEWHHVAVTYDGSERAGGVHLFVDGKRQTVDILLDKLTGGFRADQPLRIGFGAEGLRLVGALSDVRVYRRNLTADEVAMVACPDSIRQIIALEPRRRNLGQQRKLAWYFLNQAAPAALQQAFAERTAARRRLDTFTANLPTSMIMRDATPPAPTYVLERGQYDQPGERVEPGVPAWLPPLPADAPANRLGLARWLVDDAHPLTSRVVVNRAWQHFFGRGLVETAEDFGTQGTRPQHVDLLDWLATEFVRNGWDLKELHRLIVCSAVYRQSSAVRKDLQQRDPENQWLARAPRFRLPAEAVRDQALAAAGLLETRIGGPSVKPYQPAGLWKELGSEPYQRDAGQLLYRRSLYTFWKRTVPPASMATFDGPTREFCQVRRSRTNTPLQALALLNDVTYVEAARELARLMVTDGGDSDDDRLELGVRRVLARRPTDAERQVLAKALARGRAAFAADPTAAERLLSYGTLPAGEPDAARAHGATERAAYTLVASLLLNMDEAVMRE